MKVSNPARTRLIGVTAILFVAIMMGIVSCTSLVPTPRHGWNKSFGPVVPHDKFPGQCSLCHISANWTTIKADFKFDHLKETGVPLLGAHAKAGCLMCHNDRGSAKVYASRGCVGCHTDIHQGRLGKNCTDCHTQETWIPRDEIARHNRTRFPLVGAHASTACFRCHPGAQVGNFTGADTTCLNCHTADLKRVKSPDHALAPLNSDCQKCHTPTAWKPALFNHSARFPLVGGHANVACTSCHKTGAYTRISRDCAACHLEAYQKTTNPNHAQAGFSTSCGNCHTIASWQNAKFNHPADFPLTNGHANVGCNSCHKNGVFTGLTTGCVTCHQDKFQATTNPNHAVVGFGTDCATCHSTKTWLDAQFNHPAAFPLTNGHGGLKCSDCHMGNVFTGLTTACVNCHLPKYQATSNPNHVVVGFDTNCVNCHNTTSWLTAQFTHPADFPLTNAHAGVQCSSCHTGNNFAVLNTACVTCHLAKYQATSNPNHAVVGFDTTCANCHNTSSWLTAQFTHPADFPLTNAHAGVQCSTCHTGTVFAALTTACVNCHLDKYNATTNPNHAVVGYKTTCADCHNTVSWLNATFNHPADFPLTNGHAGVQCSACHTGTVFTGLTTACVSCHLNKYQATSNPNHTTSGFGTDCATCHDTKTWLDAQFNHPVAFPLTNSHAGVLCSACHKNGVYTGLTTACNQCHLDKYQAAVNPIHTVVGYGTTCENCHDTKAWADAPVNHPADFPLTNSHAGLMCSNCHAANTTLSPATTCVNCHQNKYAATTNPNHATVGFGTGCVTCHTTVSWLTATFTHPADFPLTNSHAGLSCSNCHAPGTTLSPATTCVNCHQNKYAATTNPNHATVGFGTGCATCHNTTSWLTATFNHPADFPLTNAHAGRQCGDCHKAGTTLSPATTCVNCHQDKYAATSNPIHTVVGFGTGCASCHDTVAWTDSKFAHPADFPLTNSHAGVACSSCHQAGTVRNSSTACVDCHLDKYQATTNPNHAAAGYGTGCAACHDTKVWTDAVFNHPFPRTGAHNVACTSCHPNAATPQVFTCITNCHPKPQTDGNHGDVGGYTYVSTACYKCHPTPSGGGGNAFHRLNAKTKGQTVKPTPAAAPASPKAAPTVPPSAPPPVQPGPPTLPGLPKTPGSTPSPTPGPVRPRR